MRIVRFITYWQNQYHSNNDLNSIYLYSSASNKFYIMDEASF